MAEGNFSLADVLAMSNNDRGDNFLQGNGILIILFFLIFGGWGNGFGFGGNNANAQGAFTRAELYEGFNNQDTQRKLDSISNGICDSTYALNNSINNGFNGIQRDLCTGFNSVNSGIAENRFASQQCCCETNRNIDAVRYENSQNTCAITTNATANTQKILDKLCNMEMAAKDQKIAELTALTQNQSFQLSQQAQNATLIDALRPTPIPAYVTCSPYTAMNGFGCAFNSGCGCNRCGNLA